MFETSASLLERLRGGADDASWQRFVELYRPLIARWLSRYALQSADAEDLAQQVMLAVVRKLPEFEHNGRPGAFRNWLRTITINELRVFWREGSRRSVGRGGSYLLAMLDQLSDPNSGLTRLWNDEYDRHVVDTLLQLGEAEFSPKTWLAFRRTVCDGKAPSVVAGELNMSVNAILIAKSRVLRRLRQEATGLFD